MPSCADTHSSLPPQPLHHGEWEEHETDTNDKYYYNVKTGELRWVLPREEPPAPLPGNGRVAHPGVLYSSGNI